MVILFVILYLLIGFIGCIIIAKHDEIDEFCLEYVPIILCMLTLWPFIVIPYIIGKLVVYLANINYSKLWK